MGYRRYSREFKQEACKLGSDPEVGPGSAATRLGVPEMTLRSWMRQRGLLDPRVSKQIPQSDDPRVLKEQIRQLQKQLAESEIDKEILKKAAAFFARENR
ncbi:MAG TPA: transposase [Candidatus Saccharimonadales bacterium]|nr:transposase [Candidatus Saccharimonadales bacterium]